MVMLKRLVAVLLTFFYYVLSIITTIDIVVSLTCTANPSCRIIKFLIPAHIEVHGHVLRKIEEIFGSLEERNQLCVDRLKLLVTF
ncbi:MAG: hypothetical protein JWQ40_3899 [Segetibacter sp.]|nr:hypothetical protein [Segetibacter sp.]